MRYSSYQRAEMESGQEGKRGAGDGQTDTMREGSSEFTRQRKALQSLKVHPAMSQEDMNGSFFSPNVRGS